MRKEQVAIAGARLLTRLTGNLRTYVLTAVRAYSLLSGCAHCCRDALTVVGMRSPLTVVRMRSPCTAGSVSGFVGLVTGGFSWMYGKGFAGRRNMFGEGWRDTFATGVSKPRGRGMVGVCRMFEDVVVMAYYRLSPGKESHVSKHDIVIVRERYKNNGDAFTPD